MDKCIDSLESAAIFPTVYRNSGYWRIEIDEEDMDKTAFVTHNGLYLNTTMPFGLRNATVTLQRAIDVIFSDYRMAIRPDLHW